MSKISYEGLLARFEVLINGNQLTFTSIESADTYYTVIIALEYSYVTRFITAEILQGQPLQLVDVTYSDDITVTEDAGTIVSRESLTNKSSLTQILELYPMIDAQGKAYGVVVSEETWARGKTVDMPALQFADGKWSMAEISDVLIGEKYGIIIPNLLEKTSVSVPANSKAVATSTITLTTASVSGKAAFRFPVSGRLLTTRVKCEAMYPSKYEVKTEISDVTN